MVVRVEVAPALLRWAVDRAGWDEKTAESRAPYLDEWIRGARRPTLKQIEDFSRATHAPFGQLFLLESPDAPCQNDGRRLRVPVELAFKTVQRFDQRVEIETGLRQNRRSQDLGRVNRVDRVRHRHFLPFRTT